MQTEIVPIQSVLFGSPYSGCAGFSGWPRSACVQVPAQSYWPAQNNARGAIMCVDRGHHPPAPPGIRMVRPGLNNWQHMIPQAIVPPASLLPRATATVLKPPYNLHPISDPSSSGPYTIHTGYGRFGTSSGAPGQNLGLG